MTISTAGMIEAVRTAASMTQTQEERDCLNSIANRIEILTTANAGMDLELKSIRAALNIPVNTSVQAGVIAETSRLNDEVLSLRSELSESVALANRLRRTAKEHQEENQQLRSELAELEKQEPVAIMVEHDGHVVYREAQHRNLYDIPEYQITPLYARPAPPAASQPSREQLRNLVDVVWNAVTESEEVPSTKWADELIDKAFSDLPVSQPYTVPDERVAYESFIAKRLGGSIDTRRAKNGDPEKPDYMAWDMAVGWIAWQGRAAMLAVAPQAERKDGDA